jgi:hypothetical protein
MNMTTSFYFSQYSPHRVSFEMTTHLPDISEIPMQCLSSVQEGARYAQTLHRRNHFAADQSAFANSADYELAT